MARKSDLSISPLQPPPPHRLVVTRSEYELVLNDDQLVDGGFMIIKILAVVVLVLLEIPHGERGVILVQNDYVVSIQLCNQLNPIFEALQSVYD